MKIITLQHLRKAAEKTPQIWHDALVLGRIVDGNKVEVPDNFPLDPAPSIITHATITPFTQAIPFNQWPKWAKWLAPRRRPADQGIGDTLARQLAHLGADRTAKAFERLTKIKCGCANRQAWLNSLYPYPAAPLQPIH